MRWDAGGPAGGRAAKTALKGAVQRGSGRDECGRFFWTVNGSCRWRCRREEALHGSAIVRRLFEETLSVGFVLWAAALIAERRQQLADPPARYNANHPRYLTDLIALVEDGATPFCFRGNRGDIRLKALLLILAYR